MKEILIRVLDFMASLEGYEGWKLRRKDDKNHWRFIRLYETDYSEFLKAYKGLTYNDYDEVNKGSLMTWCDLKLMDSKNLTTKDKILIEQVHQIVIGQVSLDQAKEMRQIVKSVTNP